jgi:hypothetical protein
VVQLILGGIRTRPPTDGAYGRKIMLEWFSRTTSISGVQISNYWMLVLAAVVVIWIIYRFIAG